MSKGKEADEIILLAFRQLECAIPEEVKALTELTPELLVPLVANALNLITEAETFSLAMPAGVASRHRTCTKMARGIKALGYHGECGYNQLLYPSEGTTRAILGFLVEKLPRTEEEKQEEILGPNALLNRRIMATLHAERRRPFLHPAGPSFSPSAQVTESRFRTRRFATQALDLSDSAPLVTAQVPKGQDIAPSLLERVALARVREARYEAQLEGLGVEDPLEAKDARRATVAALLRDAMATATRGHGGKGGILGSLGDEEGKGKGGSGSAKTLGELVKELEREAEGVEDEKKGTGTRFMHATEFGQEKAAATAAAARSTGNPAAAGSGDPGRNEGQSGDAPSAEQLAEAKAKAAEAEQKAMEDELKDMEKALEEKQATIAQKERDVEVLADQTRQVEADLVASSASVEELERECMVKQKTLEMLPNAVEHIKQLTQICNASSKKLVELGKEWEQHRKPLVAELRDLKSSKSKRKERCRIMIDEMKSARSEMQQMAQDVREKEERAQVLEDELHRMPKNVNRTLYTYRIMDIISSIAKQKKEIEKVIVEITQVQKDLNSVGERLSRAEALADERIFSAANRQNKDPAMVQSYRYLQDLREKFDELINAISENGKKETQARDMESKTEQLLERVSKNNMERILSDLQQVQQENQTLIKQLKSRK